MPEMLENFRQTFNKPIDELQKEFLNSPLDTYEEFFQGLIVNNKDPEKLGRCRVKVYNLHDNDIPDKDLPWAIPNQALYDGAFVVPKVGDIVTIYFDKGDIYTPIYFAMALRKKKIPSQALKDYPNNMVVYQTDTLGLGDGDYLTVNRNSGETLLTHRTGSTIRISPLGEVEINAKTVKIKGDVNNPVGGGTVVPGSGPFNCLPVCPILGPHSGHVALNA